MALRCVATSLRTLSLFCAIFQLFAAAVPAWASPVPTNDTTTKQRMIRIYGSLATLLPFAYDEGQFVKKENVAAIAGALKELEHVSHNLESDKKHIPLDPFTRLISRGLKDDLATASRLFNSGERRHSRDLIRGITGYCIGCHTSTSRGSWSFPGADAASLKGLSTLDKATYLAAVRQYDEAILYYEKALVEMGTPKLAAPMAAAWELALKRMLAIIVRVQDNPNLALELISRIREDGVVPDRLRKASGQWRVAVKEWENTAKNSAKTRTALLDQARSLVTTGSNLSTATSPESGLVHFLRASRIVNELLAQNKNDAATGELLWLGGQIAERTDALNFWTLDTGYYEACIRYQPKTNLAKQCYDRLARQFKGEAAFGSRNTELRKLAGY